MFSTFNMKGCGCNKTFIKILSDSRYQRLTKFYKMITTNVLKVNYIPVTPSSQNKNTNV